MAFLSLSKLLHLHKKGGNERRAVPDAPSTPSRTLPTELTLAIFMLAASDPSTGQAALASIARLCTSTRPWAEQRLYRHPIITSLHQLGLLRKTLKKSSRLASSVDSLTLDGSSTSPGGEAGRRNVTLGLPDLLRHAPEVKQLEIRNAVIFSLVDLAGAEHVTHLTLHGILLSDRTSTTAHHPSFARLPSLVSLTLDGASFLPSTATAFFTHSLTPFLRRLELLGACTVDGPGLKRDLCEVKNAELLRGLEELVVCAVRGKEEDEEGLRGRRAALGRMLVRCEALRRLEVAGELVEGEGEGEGLVKLLPGSLERVVVRRGSPGTSGEDAVAEQVRIARERELRRFAVGCETRGVAVTLQ